MTWLHATAMTRGKSIYSWQFLFLTLTGHKSFCFESLSSRFTFSILTKKYPNLQRSFFLALSDLSCDIEDIISPPATATVTRTCCLASEMTGSDALNGDFVEQEESSIMGSRNKKSSVWTNEKHSLYIKSIEASFINQLYNSLDMQSSQTQNFCSPNAISIWKKGHDNASTCSGQYKVLQGGCWSKKHFSRENSQLNDADGPHVSPGNPWIQHFTNGSRHGAVAFPSLRKRPLSQGELGCSNTEVTDQNFAEDTSVEKAKRPFSRKKIKTSIVAHSSNDQVVPFCTPATTKIADSYVSRKK